MVSKRIQKALEGNSAIRAMFNEGREMAAKYGEENVFDFSLGNPATPAPKALNDAIRDLLDEADAKGAAGSLGIHGYMANAGYEEVRQAIAENLNERFGTKFTAHNLVMTVGAAGGLNIIFKTILDPDDEVIVFAPFFGEYRQYAANFDAKIVIVSAGSCRSGGKDYRADEGAYREYAEQPDRRDLQATDDGADRSYFREKAG